MANIYTPQKTIQEYKLTDKGNKFYQAGFETRKYTIDWNYALEEGEIITLSTWYVTPNSVSSSVYPTQVNLAEYEDRKTIIYIETFDIFYPYSFIVTNTVVTNENRVYERNFLILIVQNNEALGLPKNSFHQYANERQDYTIDWKNFLDLSDELNLEVITSSEWDISVNGLLDKDGDLIIVENSIDVINSKTKIRLESNDVTYSYSFIITNKITTNRANKYSKFFTINFAGGLGNWIFKYPESEIPANRAFDTGFSIGFN